MKKIFYLIFIIIIVLIIVISGLFIKNVKNNVVNKTYTYTGEGFGGDFTITIRDDGTALFYEGYLSSYMGEGKWRIEDNILVVSDEMFINRFKMLENELEFIEKGSTNFMYVKVKDGEKFIGKPIEK